MPKRPAVLRGAFLYFIEGTLRLIINGTELVLHPSDSVYFNSSYPHGMQTVGDVPPFNFKHPATQVHKAIFFPS